MINLKAQILNFFGVKMFKATQILSATQLIRNFKRVSWELAKQPQALLVMQKKGEHLVLVNAEIFEELMELKFEHIQSLRNSAPPN